MLLVVVVVDVCVGDVDGEVTVVVGGGADEPPVRAFLTDTSYLPFADSENDRLMNIRIENEAEMEIKTNHKPG